MVLTELAPHAWKLQTNHVEFGKRNAKQMFTPIQKFDEIGQKYEKQSI
jgi:hypothetical protein